MLSSTNRVEMGFDGVAQFLIDQFDVVLEDLVAYFGPFERRSKGEAPIGFTGKYFERMVDESSHDRFCAADYLAPSLLSAPLRPEAIATLISIEDQLNSLIQHHDFPAWGTNLWDDEAENAISDESPLSQLYSTIRDVPHIGATRASKLLAAKRPHLVPIRDERVSGLLGHPIQWWQPWRNLVLDQQVRSAVDRLLAAAGSRTPESLTVLRCLDVALWREAGRRGF